MSAATVDTIWIEVLSRLALQGVSYDNALALAQRFIGAIGWTK